MVYQNSRHSLSDCVATHYLIFYSENIDVLLGIAANSEWSHYDKITQYIHINFMNSDRLRNLKNKFRKKSVEILDFRFQQWLGVHIELMFFLVM